MQSLKDLFEKYDNHIGDVTDLYPPLAKAAGDSDFFRLAQLLKRQSRPDLEFEVITPDELAVRPIHIAANREGDATSAALLTMLLAAGADPNTKSRLVTDRKRPLDKWTPLFRSLDWRNDAASLVLLEYGADPNAMCLDLTPMHVAAEKNNALMVR